MAASKLKSVIGKAGFASLFTLLTEKGYRIIGPHLANEAIVYDDITTLNDLPQGYIDEQEGGRYRLILDAGRKGNAEAFFRYAVGPYSWKRFLFPPVQKLWSAKRQEVGFSIAPESSKAEKLAFVGVRPCEIAALKIQDRVFDNGDFADAGYNARRNKALIIAVNCTRAANTCFCVSMNTGPSVSNGFDLALTEISDGKDHRFVIEAGSKKGKGLLQDLGGRAPDRRDTMAAAAAINGAKRGMKRSMPKDVARQLEHNRGHDHWRDVADRCLNCANCTMVCPTCFCSTVEDHTSLDGQTAERWRRWDSCFTVDFSYIHGGPIRRDGASRYRQWISHKLSTWYDQFGTSGCTGCGRCITWCPVGIDITAEIKALKTAKQSVGA